MFLSSKRSSPPFAKPFRKFNRKGSRILFRHFSLLGHFVGFFKAP